MIRFTCPLRAVALTACFTILASRSDATTLTFLNATGYTGPGTYGTLGPIGGVGYGDNVDFGAATSGSDAYGGYLRGHGWTPNITADYRTGSSGTEGVGLSFGATLDRENEMSAGGAFGTGSDSHGATIYTYKSVWPQEDLGPRPEVILTPAPGYAVVLYNYLFEAFNPTDHLLDGRTTEVRTASDAVLFSYTEPTGNGYFWNYYGVDGYTPFLPGNAPIVSTEPIRIIGDATYWRSISGIDFGQVALPEPATAGLAVVVAVFGLGTRRRCARGWRKR